VFSTIFSGTNDLIVILVAFVVLFGGSQLPKLAHNTGEALREFRKAHSEVEESTTGSVLVGNAPSAPDLPGASSAGSRADEITSGPVPQAAGAKNKP
jgi:sec-independent protein translocase protein TatA